MKLSERIQSGEWKFNQPSLVKEVIKLEAEIEALREIVIGLPEWNGKSLDYYLSPLVGKE